MSDADLITGLADIEVQLKEGNMNQQQLIERLGELLAALRNQPAPRVTVPVTVQPAAMPSCDYHHRHVYDDRGRCIETISTRVMKG